MLIISIHRVERAYVISLREEQITKYINSFKHSIWINATARGKETTQLCCTRTRLNLYTIVAGVLLQRAVYRNFYCGCIPTVLSIIWPPYFYSTIWINTEYFRTSVPLCFIHCKDFLMVHLQFPQIPLLSLLSSEMYIFMQIARASYFVNNRCVQRTIPPRRP